MPDITLDIEVRCADCGSDLEVEVEGGFRHVPEFIVKPCDTCIDSARSEGYDEGHQDGVDSVVIEE